MSVCAALGLAAGCTVKSDEGASFGGSVTITTTVGTTASGGESTTEGGETSTAEGESTTAAADEDSSTGGVDSTVSVTASTSGAVEESSSGGGDGGGMQPQDGMYSHCLTPQECVGVNLCITITPQGQMMPSTGFCTTTGCANPAADCDANPGGTATPMCFPVTVNMVMEMACALDCSGGKTCPAPMTCQSVSGGMICA